MKKLVLIIGALLPIFCAAQNEVDALRYSQNFNSGTARYNAMGGAFGALGGDFSSLSTNPAGLGIYRSSEFMFTPQFSYNSSSTKYTDIALDDYKFRMNFANVGFVATHVSGREEGWVTTSFAVGYNRLADFNHFVKIEGQNNSSSMTDYFAALAKDKDSETMNYFNEGLAWDAYLIDPTTPGATTYKSALPRYGEIQRKDINTKGGMGEYVISLAGNYSNKLYMGGTLGIQTIRYVENSFYSETDPHDSIPSFNKFDFQNDLKTTGAGFNFKFGLIYRPADWIRIGGAIHSPTFFNMHDEYNSSIQSSFSDTLHGTGEKVNSTQGTYDYELTTPFRAIGSLGFVISKFAIIGVEYEYIDYTTARLRADDYPFNTENNTIENAYTATGNIKVGAEFKNGPFSLRGGYCLYGSPYRSGQINENAIHSSYNAGFGIRNDDFYFDMAFTYLQGEEKYFLYDQSIVSVPPANIKNTNVGVMATFGFKF
ncbi:MAG: hypothetical protein HY951_12045 [Bacteroidia bacterium]|nr:hypothetical protein [Bacteroidia bacterium]